MGFNAMTVGTQKLALSCDFFDQPLPADACHAVADFEGFGGRIDMIKIQGSKVFLVSASYTATPQQRDQTALSDSHSFSTPRLAGFGVGA